MSESSEFPVFWAPTDPCQCPTNKFFPKSNLKLPWLSQNHWGCKRSPKIRVNHSWSPVLLSDKPQVLLVYIQRFIFISNFKVVTSASPESVCESSFYNFWKEEQPKISLSTGNSASVMLPELRIFPYYNTLPIYFPFFKKCTHTHWCQWEQPEFFANCCWKNVVRKYLWLKGIKREKNK